jgi:hypothetical protein
MKRNDIFIITGTIAYSILFYKQLAGLNFLLFNLLLTGMMGFKNTSLLREPRWLIMAGAALFTSFCIVWQGTWLAINANIVSLLLLAASSINPKSSVILNFFFSFYSMAGSFIFIILRMVDPAFREKREDSDAKDKKSFSWRKFLTFFLPFLVILIFFFIYRSANPLFKKFTNEINLDFISLPWIGFTFTGFLVACGLFYQYRVKAMDKWEAGKPKHLAYFENQKTLKFINEKNAALFLFGMLNLMLFFINGVDINYLYLGAGLPKEITHSDFVHDGVGMLIFSIIIAVTLIIFFFRGNLNFEDKARGAKFMVYLWIIQNIMMIVSTILRNNIYVEEYQLTYKRIGVYIYLTLAIIGLLTTFYKILDKRTNWFLFRSNAWAGFMLLVGLSAIDFDLLITRYNIAHTKDVTSLDKSYLLSLSDTNIPELYAIREDTGFNYNSPHHYSRFFNLLNESGQFYSNNKGELDNKLLEFLQTNSNYGWRSWNRRRERIYNEIVRLNESGMISRLDYSNGRIKDLGALAPLKKLKGLSMSYTGYSAWTDLANFQELEQLDVRNCGIRTLDSFPVLKSLKEINLTGNPVSDFRRLNLFPQLEKLEYLSSQFSSMQNFPQMSALNELNLSYGNFENLDFLKQQPSLRKFELAGGHSQKPLPSLPGLKVLNFSNNKYGKKQTLIKSLMMVPNLEELYLADNDLQELSFLYYSNPDKTFSPNYPELKKLDLTYNNLRLAENLFVFTKLEELNLSRNKLLQAPNIQFLPQLKKLNLSANLFSDINHLGSMNQLEELDLSDNNTLTDFSALRGMTGLKKLNISRTRIDRLDNLSEMKKLKELKIEGTNIESLSGITNLSALETLSLASLTKADAEQLKKLKKLKKVILGNYSEEIKMLFAKELKGVQLEFTNTSRI